VRALLVAVAFLAATSARAESPPAATEEQEHSAWELDLFAGYGQLAFPATDTANVAWSHGGPAFALGVAYRGPHFTHPFVDVSYIPVLASEKYVEIFQPGGATTVRAKNSSFALGLAIGPGWDVDWFRIRVGVGLYDVFVTTDVLGQPNTVSQISIGFLASMAAMVWRPEPFALGVEARIVALQFPASGIYQAMWSAGLTGRWDFVRN
jgi:hypothetical protein